MARSIVWDLGGHCELLLQRLHEMYRGDCGVYGYPVTLGSHITTACEFPHMLWTLHMARWAPMHALWVLCWALGLYRGLCEFIYSISSDGEHWEWSSALWAQHRIQTYTQGTISCDHSIRNSTQAHYDLHIFKTVLWLQWRCSMSSKQTALSLTYGLWEQHRFTVRSIQATTSSSQGYVN